jgi:hypothetical protein
MPKGSFRVFPDPKNPRDIYFEVAPDAPDPKPEDQLALKDEVDAALRVLRALYSSDKQAQFDEGFRSLLLLAQAGLVGTTADPIAAHRALVSLKRDITDREAEGVKNGYMKKLGACSAWFGAPPFLLGTTLWLCCTQTQEFASFLLLWSGTMAGVWISFGVRKSAFQFEDLVVPEQDRVRPEIRLVFAGLLSLIIGLLLALKAVTITVGSISTDAFVGNFKLALLLGLLLGFSENVLPTKVAEQASRFLNFPK